MTNNTAAIDHHFSRLFMDVRGIYTCFDRGHDVKHFIEVTGLIEEIHDKGLISNDNYILLITAAAYHDTGRIIDNYDHELHSVKIFNRDKFIKRFVDFSEDEMNIINNIILHHRGKYKAETELEKIMKDADHISTCNLDRALERLIYYQIDNFQEVYHENPKDMFSGLKIEEVILLLVKKQIARKPLYFKPLSEITALIHPEISYNPDDNYIMGRIHLILDKENKYELVQCIQ